MLEVYERNNVICAEGLIESIGQKVFLYLVDGMLIDCGPEILQEELLPFFRTYTFKQVILTHNHEDHTGNAAWIQNNMDKPIYIHPAGLAVCLVDGEYPAYRQFTWGGRKAFAPGVLKSEIVSNTLEWKTLYTPGHADDHIALYNQDRKLMFTGDLYVSSRTKVSMKTESIPQIMASIELVLQHDFEAIYCSHAGYLENGRELLEKKLSYLAGISVKVQALMSEGKSAREIADFLFPGDYPIIQFSEREWDTVHMVASFMKNPAFK
ncbi:MBL fold metallo-hydrolase [Planococcus halotolerans]|nr:MBL fold metallo-hydrolase [Planococcus halotolerans]QHJ71365.1 MBL fold metallo-hydrolase [Planococcus halotolerans]